MRLVINPLPIKINKSLCKTGSCVLIPEQLYNYYSFIEKLCAKIDEVIVMLLPATVVRTRTNFHKFPLASKFWKVCLGFPVTSPCVDRVFNAILLASSTPISG